MYKALKKQEFAYKKYKIVPYREQDIYLIMDWRNKQIDVLRQKKTLTETDQQNYYSHFIVPSFEQQTPKIILFSLLYEDNCIGYGGLTNIDWEDKRVELSFLVNNERAANVDLYEQDFSAFINLMKSVTFMDLGFNRIFTETYDIRLHHLNILEKNGFRLEGRLMEHIFINGNFVDSLIHGTLKKDYHV